MTKDEAIDQYEHAFAGMVLDAWNTQRTGAQAMDFVRKISPSTRQMLSGLFDAAMRIAAADQAKFLPSEAPNGLFGEDGKKKRSNKISEHD